jgi:DivIVA domain-containing protein
VDREEIERRDFPAARRGYDAAAVHEHLRRVADEFEALGRRPAPGSLAEGASARVQAIIDAAETSAQQLRDDAGRDASAHVERVGEAARELLAKLDRLQGELDRLLGGLKSSAESLTGSLDELSRDVGTLGGGAPAAPAPAAGEPTQPAPAAAEPTQPPEPAPAAAEPTQPPEPAPAAAEPTQPPEPAPAAANGARSDDEAGARLVALNMALEGAPRDETLRYLAEHFELPDLDALLDDVYTSAGR